MFSTRSIERLAGAFLVVGLAAFLAHGLTLDQGVVPMTVLLVLVYGFMIILSALLVYLIFHSHERTLALFGAFGLAAHGVFAVLVCALLLTQLEFAQEFGATGGAEPDSVAAAARALALTMNMIRAFTFLFLGLGLVPLGVLIAWSGAVARWLGWLGVVASVLGFLGVLAGLFNVGEGGLMIVGIFLMFGFVLVLGVRLLVRKTLEATEGAQNGYARESPG